MKGRKRIVAIFTILIMIINMFSPYTLLINKVDASTGTIEKQPVILNNLGVTTKGSNKIITIEMAIVSEEIINGLDLQFKVDTSKIAPCNKNTGTASSVMTLNSTVSDYCGSSFQKKSYNNSTGIYRFTLTEPQGGTDIVNGLGYVPGTIGDDAIDVNGEGYPAYYPIIKLFFRVTDPNLDTDNLILDDLFNLVPVAGSLPTGMKISYKNASGVNVSKDITQFGQKGFAKESKTVSSIKIKNEPNKKTYIHGEDIDLTGGIITVIYTDGSEEDIEMTNKKVSISSGTLADVNKPQVTISYGDVTTEFEITVNDPVDKLNVKTPMSVNEYTHGENINFDDLELEAVRRSGATETLKKESKGLAISETIANVNSNEFTKVSTESDGTVRGSQKIKFTYEGKEAVQTIIVNDTINKVNLKTQPNKKIYKRGESLDLTGASVEITLTSGGKTTIDLPDLSVIVSKYNPTLVGNKQKLQVSINGIVSENTIDVEVYNYITSIQMTAPTKDLYNYNEELNLTGGKIRATWKSGTTSQIPLTDETVSISGYNKTEIGSQTIEVTYSPKYTLSDGTIIQDSFKDVFYIEVQDPVSSIVITKPSKTTYKHGESIDTTGGKITVTTISGATKEVPMTAAMITETDNSIVNMKPQASDFGTNTLLNKSLKITYTEGTKTETINYPITIINDVRSIQMHTTPKTEYNVNDSLDITKDGRNYGEILVTRAVGTPEVIALNEVGVEITGFDSSKEKTNLPINVKYTENGISKTTSYNVNVKDTVKSVKLKTTPKTEYKYNEELDVSGGEIEIEKGSGTTTIPLESSMVTGYDKTKLGEQEITINYGGKTATYKIKVKDYITGITVTPSNVTGNYNDTLENIIANNSIKYTLNYAKAGDKTAELKESMVSGYDPKTIEKQKVKIAYTDNDTESATNTEKFETELEITLLDKVDAINIIAPTKTTYRHGESIDTTGGTITVTTISGATKEVPMTASMITETDGSTVNMRPRASDFGTNTLLNKSLKITYTENGKTETVNYPITIINDVRSIAMYTIPKTEYNVNDSLDITKDGKNYGEILVTRAVGTPEVIALNEVGVEITGFDSSKEQTNLPINVKYTENGISKTTSYNVNVKDTVKTIKLKTTPKTGYKYNEELDVSGGEIEIEKGSGTTTIPLESSMVTGYDKTKLGEQEITINYGGKTATYKIKVKDYITEITVTPSNVTGNYNDTLENIIANNSIKYTLNYAKAGAKTAELKESMVSGYNPKTIEKQKVKIAYTDNDTESATNTEKFETELEITLLDKVDAINIIAPTKTTYKHGESIDTTGGTITVTTISGATKEVPMTTSMITETDGATVNMRPRASDFGASTTLNKTLKITYTENGKTETVNYPITIINDVRSIAMYTIPKTEYNVNDSLDITKDGKNYGEILVTRAVGTPEVVALNNENIDIKGFDSSKEKMNLPITVKYTENQITQSTSYNVNIQDTVKSVKLKTTPKTEYKYNEELDVSGGEIEIEKGSGTTTIPLESSMVTGYDKTKLGEQEITINYGGKNITYKVKVKDYVTGVLINPNKIEGIVDTELEKLLKDNNVKYQIIYAKNGAQEHDLTETLINGYDKTVKGEQNIIFNYKDTDDTSATLGDVFTSNLKITLSNPTIGINIKSKPNKTEYGYNETPDFGDGVITVISANGDKKDISFTDKDVTITEIDGSEVDLKNTKFGEDHTAIKTIKVDYDGKSETFQIKVINKLDSIKIKTSPKTEYTVNDKIDLSIGTVEIKRENGELEEIPLSDSRLEITGFDSTKEKENILINVKYNENNIFKETNYNINVRDEIKSISIETTPKTEYKYEEPLDVSKGILKVIKATGDIEYIQMTSDMVKEENGEDFDSTKLGTRNLVVNYGKKQLTYEITVSDYIKNIILTPPTKVKYEYGEVLDLTGGKIETVMASGKKTDTIALTDQNVVLSKFNPNKVGAQTINVTYGTFTDGFGVIVEDNIKGIQISKLPEKLTYKYGESLDLTGGKITVIRSSGPAEIIDITPSMVTGYDPNILGNQTLTVTHAGKIITYNVEVKDWVKDIEIVKPNKLIYKINERIDLTGGQVIPIMASGITGSPITMTNSMIQEPSTATVGAKEVKVSYEEITKTFGIVVQDLLSSIKIKTLPNKTEYKYGEKLDLTGGTIEITKESGTTEVIAMTTNMVSGYNSTKIGKQTLTVTFEDFKDNFIVNVNDYMKELKIIVPNKTQYEYGEELDLSGGKVSIIMASGNIQEITDMTASMIFGFNSKQEGTQTIQVKYKGFTGSFNVNVVDKIKEISLKTEPNKTIYEYGETLDTTGASITIIKSSGIYTVNVTNEMVTGYNPEKVGNQVLNINYGGFTTKFIVSVNEKKNNTNIVDKPNIPNYPSNIPTKALVTKEEPKEDDNEIPKNEIMEQPEEEPTIIPQDDEKPTVVLGEKDDKQEKIDDQKIIAGTIGLLGIILLLILLVFKKNVKIYVEEDGKWAFAGFDKINKNNAKINIDKYLDGENYQNRVKIVLNDSISEKMDKKEIEIKHRNKLINHKVEYNDEPYEIILE